jgi:CheY-like chemotaxis protein
VADATEDRRRPARVLLVDDDPKIRAMYGRRLGADGFEVSFATDGSQALTAASCPPAIILLDLRMPGMNGLEVLGRLKKDANTAAVPVVMLSNDGDPETMATCVRTGAVAWWIKSALVPAELSKRVRELLTAGGVLV